MKKLLFSVFLLSSVASSYAQEKTGKFSKGSRVVSGMFSFTTSSEGEEKSTSFSVSPRAGMFITDNLLVGLSVGAGNSMSKLSSVTTEDVSDFHAGVFSRLYSNPASNFSVFGQTEAGFENENDKISKVTTRGFNLSFSPGISYFLSNNFILEAMLGKIEYSTSKTDIPDSKATSNFDIDFNIGQLQFGMMYKF